MTITYTGNLKLALPTTGTESGAWGDVVNQQLTSLLDQSVAGTVSLTGMTDADYTLTSGNGNLANEARYMAFSIPATLTLTAARNVIVPTSSKSYIVRNLTTGGFAVTVKTVAGTGISVPNGKTMALYCDGVNVLDGTDYVASLTAGSITDSGNLAFTGTGNRITGDFSNATIANRVMFQTSTVNGNSTVGVIPNGTATSSGIGLFSKVDTANAEILTAYAASGSAVVISADKTGTGSYLPMTFYTGGSEKMRIDTSGNVTFQSTGSTLSNVTSINGGQLAGLRNRIINGGMQVAQRGSVAVVNGTATYGGADRTAVLPFGFTTATGTIAQSVGSALNATNTAQSATVTTTGTGSLIFLQRIEASNASSLNGKTATISAKAVHNVSGQSYPVSITILKANSVDNFTATTNITTSGTLSAGAASTALSPTFTYTFGAADCTNGIAIYVTFGSVGVVTSGTFAVTDFQLELGSVATTFEQRPYGMELALCQRYYEVGYIALECSLSGVSYRTATWFFKQEKRAIPTIAITSSSGSPIAGTVTVYSANISNTTGNLFIANTTASAEL